MCNRDLTLPENPKIYTSWPFTEKSLLTPNADSKLRGWGGSFSFSL